uniref:Uncharacterized protein n=1 Tax=Leersia perrieri TaxID=77586 RepID=A0A0D9WFT4_9ORYZ
MQRAQETCKSVAGMEPSDAMKVMEETSPKVVAFSPVEAAVAKPRSSPLAIESSKVKRSELATLVTFYMIPSLLVASKHSIPTSILVGAVFHQIYMFHKEIFLDYVHHDITRKWALIYFKLLLLIMAKETIRDKLCAHPYTTKEMMMPPDDGDPISAAARTCPATDGHRADWWAVMPSFLK